MTHAELHERQGWTLQQKIGHSLEVIETFVSRMGGLDKVYCSFSGGKELEEIDPEFYSLICGNGDIYVSMDVRGYDWLNKNHFDYRGLIEKGLAIDATGLNIY